MNHNELVTQITKSRYSSFAVIMDQNMEFTMLGETGSNFDGAARPISQMKKLLYNYL